LTRLEACGAVLLAEVAKEMVDLSLHRRAVVAFKNKQLCRKLLCVQRLLHHDPRNGFAAEHEESTLDLVVFGFHLFFRRINVQQRDGPRKHIVPRNRVRYRNMTAIDCGKQRSP
jgi:hypothetical protein